MKNYSGDKRVAINMTTANDNYEELEDVVKTAKEKDFNGVVCNICAEVTNVSVAMVVREKERENIIRELKRVKTLYPKDFLLSKKMIKWYEYPDHRESCYWGDEVLHFDVSWNRRRRFGNNVDCSNCGCLAGSFQSHLGMLRHPKEMLKIVIC